MTNGEDRFMDALLARILGDAEAPAARRAASEAPTPRRSLGTHRRDAPWWVWSAAAILLMAVGLALGRMNRRSADEPTRPLGIQAPATARVEREGSAMRVVAGYALVDGAAPPIAFGDGVMRPIEGQAVVVAGSVPTGEALKQMLVWLASEARVASDDLNVLRRPERWFAGRASAMAVLSGGVVLDGRDELRWQGRAWPRTSGDTPPRVAIVVSRSSLARLARSVSAVKVADVDANGSFVSALAAIPSLEDIDLSGCRAVDDAALRRLGDLEHLKALRLAHTRVGNRGLAWLSGLERLARLDLRGLTRITADGLELLVDTHRHRLAHLDLRGGRPTDSSVLRVLARLTALETLSLSLPAAPDVEALRSLAALSRLRLLRIETGPGGLPDALLELLRTALPNCEIRVAQAGTPR